MKAMKIILAALLTAAMFWAFMWWAFWPRLDLLKPVRPWFHWLSQGDRALCIFGPIFLAVFVLFVMWAAFIKDHNKYS